MRERTAAWWLALAVSIAIVPDARAQVSPGPLAAAHGEWDGLTKCFACHSRSESMTARCLDCHAEIAWSRDRGRGLHARAEFAECTGCHPDHAGRDFAMVQWDEGTAERFRHERTGYALKGAHARVRCERCHAVANQTSPVARHIRKKDRGRSYLGLERACASCHEDPHAGRFGADCERCHHASAWKDLDPAGFDHDRTRYPLRGRHASVACADCHDAVKAWGPKPRFDRCDACHGDAHGGQATLAGRAADCAACHGVAGFAPSTYTAARHAKSRYPLRGRHRAVACAACHLRRPAGVPAGVVGAAGVWLRPKHGACGDCHGNPHGSQISGDAKALACVSCHDLDAFKPSRFDGRSHAKTAFPLEGAHVGAACRACHDAHRAGLAPIRDPARLGPAGFAMHLPERACAECHADPHRGRFVAGCTECHGTGAFRPARVGVAEHARFAFPLEGAHRAVSCVDCHAELRRGAPPSTLARAAKAPPPMTFAVAEKACADCHRSPHGDQFDAPASRARSCERCHGLDVFRPASRFDHDRDTGFALDGAHRTVACGKCHETAAAAKSAGGRGVVRYRGVSSKCEFCHPVTGAKR